MDKKCRKCENEICPKCGGCTSCRTCTCTVGRKEERERAIASDNYKED